MSKNKWLLLALGLSVLSIIGIVFTAHQPSDNSFVRTVRYVYTPWQRGVDVIRNNWQGVTGFFSSKKVLNETIAQLEVELGNAKIENQALQEYRAEANRLQVLWDFHNNNLETYDLIAARVIARSANSWTKSMIISKGTQDGLKENMTVISPDGLVGRLSMVFPHTAEVSLITDREVAVGAIFAENRETNGIVEGIGENDSLRMVNIPYYAKIYEHEQVLTSGLSSIYPKGIVIGTVQTIDREENGILLKTILVPAVNFNHLEEVLVITGFHPPVE